MPIPSVITDLSTSAASNSPSGSDSPVDGDNFLRSHAAFIAQLRDGTGLTGLADTDLTASGDALVGVKRTATSAIATTQHAVNEARPYYPIPDFGAIGNGSTDDYTAIQACLDAANAQGGGAVLGGGKTYRVTSPLVIPDDVTFDLQGGKILSALSGSNDYGVRLRNRSNLCNGEIEVSSTGSPGSQAGIHAPILIGPLYGSGGTVASPATDEGVSCWSVKNMKVWTNRDGKVGIQINGGANNGLIDGIECPDSTAMFGVVHMDWGALGTVDSSDITATRANFDGGTAYTTHPHNIVVRNVKAGSLSRTKSGVDTGSHVVRISGCYNIRVENVRAKQCTYAGVRVTAGDVGFEFAPSAIKPLRMKNIVIDGVAIENTTDSWAVYADSYADNVAGATSYTSLIDPLHETNLIVNNVVAKGSAGASVTAGLDIRQIRGGKFTNFDLQGYQYGCLVDELVYGVQIHGRFHNNRGHGIYIHHGTNKPQDVEVLPGTHCYQNGTDAGFSNPAGINIDGSIRCYVNGALLGHRTSASETTQLRGLRVDSNATDVRIENCHVFNVDTGGVGYSLLTSTDYNIIKLFRNNTADSGITTKISGLNILPVSQELGPDGTVRGVYVATEASLTSDTTPTAGTWVQGDRIYYTDPDASDFVGTVCTAAGSPGTWKRFGATQA